MHATAEATRPQPIRFRGRSYVAFVFTPVVPIVSWLEEIDATLARSPGFFVGRPVVLDLAGVRFLASAGVGIIMAAMRNADGIRGQLHLVGVADNLIVSRVLDITGVRPLLDIHPGLEHLLASLGHD